jgi:tRNA 2-selenouridine synthase
VGRLRVPERLMERMREGRCLAIELTPEARVALLIEEYAHLIARPEALVERLEFLSGLHPRALIDRWKALVASRDWPALVESLLAEHYDPAYRRSMFRNYRQMAGAATLVVADTGAPGFLEAARRFLEDPVQ